MINIYIPGEPLPITRPHWHEVECDDGSIVITNEEGTCCAVFAKDSWDWFEDTDSEVKETSDVEDDDE